MANSTSLNFNAAGSLILSEPYLMWLEKGVFPYIFGTCCLLTIILGSIFNIAICKLFANEEHSGIKMIITQFMATDILSGVFVLAPEAYLSFSASENIPGAFCTINGIFNITTFLIHFGLLSVGLAISCLTLQANRKHPDLCQHTCIIICVCVSSLVVALIPVSFDDGYEYKTNEYQCTANRSKHKAYIHVVFFLGVLLSIFLTCVASSMLFKSFMSQNKKVSHSQSVETIVMEDQTRSSVECQEDKTAKKPNRFKSKVTISIEDQTKTYGRLEKHETDDQNRFKSEITVSMEDHTRSYERNPLRGSVQTGDTVSMDDQTRSFDEGFKPSTMFSASSFELSGVIRPRNETANCLEDITSAHMSTKSEKHIFTTTNLGQHETFPFGVHAASHSNCCHDSLHALNNAVVKNYECMTESDDEVSFDGSYGPGIISSTPSARSASRANVENDTRKRKSLEIRSGRKKREGKGALSNFLKSTLLNKNITFKVAATYTIVSWVVLACWLPFVIIVYIDMYGDTWWGGWLTLALVCGNITYCIKPIIILGIRGQLLKATKGVLPKSVEDRAGRITSAVTKTIDKITKRLY